MALLSIDGVTESLQADLVDGVATFTLNRPQVLNALNHEQRSNLELAFRAAAGDDAIKVVVLRGAGRAFCAGQDQKESASMDADGAARRIAGYTSLYRTMRSLGKSVIACLTGYATGAGLQLALLSDLRIADEQAKFGMTELNVGSAPIMGSAFLLPVVGESVMKRLVLLSDFIDARTALSMNLVHEVHAPERLQERVREIAGSLVPRSPLAVELTKRWWKEMGDALFEAAMDNARSAHAQNYAAGGLSKGAQAFVSRTRER